MTLENFEKLIALQKAYDKKISEAYSLGIDLIEFLDSYSILILLLKEIYNDRGVDWIEWYLYERTDDGTPQAWDENKNPIAYDVPSLYMLLENYKK